MRKDAVDPQNHEWKGEQERRYFWVRHCITKNMQQDPPRKHSREAADHACVGDVMPIDRTGVADKRRLHQKRERSVREWKIDVWHLPLGHACGIFKYAGHIIEDG